MRHHGWKNSVHWANSSIEFMVPDGLIIFSTAHTHSLSQERQVAVALLQRFKRNILSICEKYNWCVLIQRVERKLPVDWNIHYANRCPCLVVPFCVFIVQKGLGEKNSLFITVHLQITAHNWPHICANISQPSVCEAQIELRHITQKPIEANNPKTL